jgi:uncharacterized Rmd1/YagE family protein
MASKTILVKALLIGHGLDLRSLSLGEIVARNPMVLHLEDDGLAVLFRFGVVLLVDAQPEAESAFLSRLEPVVQSPIENPVVEVLELVVEPGSEERIVDGRLNIPESEVTRIQVIADILAKSLLLEDYEEKSVAAFDRIEPFAEHMRMRVILPRQARELLRHIGDILQIKHRMVGRAQVGEKPDILWDRPDLERLWQRLENEYEISERQSALDRRLDLLSETVETVLRLLQERRTLRVEWYITILIVIEIFLTLYELFFRHA